MKRQPNPTGHMKRAVDSSATLPAGIEDRDLRVEIFAICEGATEQSGRLSLVGVYETLAVPGFPMLLPQLTVALRIRFWPAENRRHTVRLVMTTPDGMAAACTGEEQMTLHPISGDRSAACNVICRFQNVRIEESGDYTLDFHLNHRIEARLPFAVDLILAGKI